MIDPIVMIDTREKKYSHITEWFEANSIRTFRHGLPVGDYTLYLDPSVCIDRKAGLQEVYGNIIQDHKRFKEELIRARYLGSRILILVEQPEIMKIEDVADWRNPRWEIWEKGGRKGWPPASSVSLMRAMKTISEKYGAEWEFCDRSMTAQRIVQILKYGG